MRIGAWFAVDRLRRREASGEVQTPTRQLCSLCSFAHSMSSLSVVSLWCRLSTHCQRLWPKARTNVSAAFSPIGEPNSRDLDLPSSFIRNMHRFEWLRRLVGWVVCAVLSASLRCVRRRCGRSAHSSARPIVIRQCIVIVIIIVMVCVVTRHFDRPPIDSDALASS